MIASMSQRKRTEADRRLRAAATIAEELRVYASAHGGRFVLFGSFASGAMRYDSDLDVLIDFGPADAAAAAWGFVEAACARAAIEGDIHDAATTRAAFVRRAVETGIELR